MIRVGRTLSTCTPERLTYYPSIAHVRVSIADADKIMHYLRDRRRFTCEAGPEDFYDAFNGGKEFSLVEMFEGDE